MLALLAFDTSCVQIHATGEPRWIWPTENTAYANGERSDAFVQATESGNPTSGLFGCVRGGGTRFHEGIDLRSVRRDRSGEAVDKVFAVYPGRVAYINKVAGNSAYGRYAIIQHSSRSLAFVTLYAHLRRFEPGIAAGSPVSAGQLLGVMGRTAAGYSIPKSRAHLHFEVGLRLSDQFQNWYDAKRYDTGNQHGVWNGMNLIGLDPLTVFEFLKSRPSANLKTFIDSRQTALKIAVHAKGSPDFVRRYPSLLTGNPDSRRMPYGWEIEFTACGLPKRWRALARTELPSPYVDGRVELLGWDSRQLDTCRCRQLITDAEGAIVIGPGLRRMLEILFGFTPR